MAEGYKELEFDDVEKLIINCQQTLNKRFRLTDNVLAALRKLEVLDDDVIDQLSAENLTPVQKKVKLMKAIEQNGVQAFLDFCLALNDKDIKQGHLVKEVFKLKTEDIERQREELRL